MARVAVRFAPATVAATGLIAGAIFAAFEMLAAAVVRGPEFAAMPLRMIAAMVLGEAALESGYPLVAAALAGMTVHLVFSILFTALFAGFVVPAMASAGVESTGHLVTVGIAFGITLWSVSFHLIAPAVGWSWFAESTDSVVQIIAHGFFFGAVIGWMLGGSRRVVLTAW